ncbi:MAG: ATP-dependent Clp protease adaptor ClpS [Alphaproteobacteria bacterium]
MTARTQKSPDTIVERERQDEKPKKWKVVFLNDDFTPMEFVVNVLTSIFHHTQENAIAIMLEVHHKGRAIVGAYSWEVAETKVDKVLYLAAQKEYPLQAVIEP